MSYDKQTWVSGEKVTAVKLNHMEDGIYNASRGGGGGGSGVLVAHAPVDASVFVPDEQIIITTDKTFAELVSSEYSVLSLDITVDGNVIGAYMVPSLANMGEAIEYGISVSIDGTTVALSGYLYDDGSGTAVGYALFDMVSAGEAHDIRIYYNQENGYYITESYQEISSYAYTSSFASNPVVANYNGRLIQLTEVKNYGSGNNPQLIFSFTEDGVQTVITIACDSQEQTVGLSIDKNYLEPFILHGTITDPSTMSGTISENVDELNAAVLAHRRIISQVNIGTEHDEIVEIDCVLHQYYPDGYREPFVTGMCYYEVASNPALMHFEAYVDTTGGQDSGVLAFRSEFFALTPLA